MPEFQTNLLTQKKRSNLSSYKVISFCWILIYIFYILDYKLLKTVFKSKKICSCFLLLIESRILWVYKMRHLFWKLYSLIAHLFIIHSLTVQVGGGHGGDEELAAVGVGAGVGHAQHPRHLVIHHKPLVLELVPVNTVAPVPLRNHYCQNIAKIIHTVPAAQDRTGFPH